MKGHSFSKPGALLIATLFAAAWPGARRAVVCRPMHIRSIVAPLIKWFAGNARDLPWRWTRDPYAIWVSEIMLQQTQVKTVIPYWQRWMKQLPDIASLAAADEDTVIKLWEGLGYYSRARNLQKAAKRIRDEFGGRFPRDLAGVLALPGVGRYTGGAICSIAFNQPEPIVDGNVARACLASKSRRRPSRSPIAFGRSLPTW